MKRKKKLDYDNKIISFLSEQRLIAKDLNIINHDLDHIIFLSETFKALTADPNLSSYYLRGVKFLDKQIDIIKSRKYIEFADMEKEINLLKKEKIDFVNYSMETISVKSLKKKFYSVLFKSILLGLIIGIFYVIIFNALQPQIASRK